MKQNDLLTGDLASGTHKYMHSLNNTGLAPSSLVYRKFKPELIETEIIIDRPDLTFKRVRRWIKPDFMATRISYDNVNGVAAHQFNRRIARFKSDWLEFILPEYSASPADYPDDKTILELGLIQDTETGDSDYWAGVIREEINRQQFYLLVELAHIADSNKPRRMFLGGLPAEYWPAKFRVFDYIITNAPSCIFVQNRSSLLL